MNHWTSHLIFSAKFDKFEAVKAAIINCYWLLQWWKYHSPWRVKFSIDEWDFEVICQPIGCKINRQKHNFQKKKKRFWIMQSNLSARSFGTRLFFSLSNNFVHTQTKLGSSHCSVFLLFFHLLGNVNLRWRVKIGLTPSLAIVKINLFPPLLLYCYYNSSAPFSYTAHTNFDCAPSLRMVY